MSNKREMSRTQEVDNVPFFLQPVTSKITLHYQHFLGNYFCCSFGLWLSTNLKDCLSHLPSARMPHLIQRIKFQIRHVILVIFSRQELTRVASHLVVPAGGLSKQPFSLICSRMPLYGSDRNDLANKYVKCC